MKYGNNKQCKICGKVSDDIGRQTQEINEADDRIREDDLNE